MINHTKTSRIPACDYSDLVKWKYLVEEKTEKEFMARSVLSKYDREEGFSVGSIDDHASAGFFQAVNLDLLTLFRLAWMSRSYWGLEDTFYAVYSHYPVIEVRDSVHEKVVAALRYNYSLSVPKERATKEGLMLAMQHDLQDYFGYTARIETRQAPCWILTATDKAKKSLISSSSKTEFLSEAGHFSGRKVSMKNLVWQILHYKPDYIPVIDETGITQKIDLDFYATMIDMEDVQKALSKQGLILEKSSKPMKVLIIRETRAPSAGN
jgi:uncharacterized protein (TIGR03435 family)